MTKIKLFTFLGFVLFLWISIPASASDFFVGASVAPVVGFDSDFNQSNKTSGLHLGVGIEMSGSLTKQKTGFWNNCLFESRFGFVVPATYNFGPTQTAGGTSGNFSETVSYYTATLGIKKFFTKHGRLLPHAGLALGASYIKLEDIEYNDALGTQLDIDVSSSAINLDMSPFVGISYRISHKLFVDAGFRAHLLVPSFFNNSYFEIPVGLRLGF